MSYVNRIVSLAEERFRKNNDTPRRMEYHSQYTVFFEYMKENGNLVITDHAANEILQAEGIEDKHYVITTLYPANGELTISVMKPGIIQKEHSTETFNINMGEDEAFQFSVVPHLFNITPDCIKKIVAAIEKIDSKSRK